MAKECMICLSEEDEETVLLRLPCDCHYICTPSEDSNCLEQHFRQAIQEERNYPVSCCEAGLLISDFEAILPFEFVWEFMRKEREFAVQPKLRVYCADAKCSAFLHPDSYMTDAGITYAKCETCLSLTCTSCKTLLITRENLARECTKTFTEKHEDGHDKSQSQCQSEHHKSCASCEGTLLTALVEHTCEVPESEQKFKLAAKESGYQECGACGKVIELAEACNHMTCECGHQFCYVCGRDWEFSIEGCRFGCPQYGKARYDDEGYNQNGFHRDTGMNREGQTPMDLGHVSDRDDDDEGDDDDNIDPHGLLNDLDPEQRNVILTLPRDEIDEILLQLAVERFLAAERGEIELGGGSDEEDTGEDTGEDAGEDANEEDADEEVPGDEGHENLDSSEDSDEEEDRADEHLERAEALEVEYDDIPEGGIQDNPQVSPAPATVNQDLWTPQSLAPFTGGFSTFMFAQGSVASFSTPIDMGGDHGFVDQDDEDDDDRDRPVHTVRAYESDEEL